MSDPTKPFHASQGWFFNREPDGSVVIHVEDDDLELHVSANTWASITAHVCACGETAATFLAALEFHQTGQTKLASSPSGPKKQP